jgi:hypothetical protein
MMALVLVMVLSVGMLTACGETEPTTNKPTTAPEKDVVGVIKEISSTFVVLETYAVEQDIIMYDKLDVAALQLSGEVDYVFISSSAVFGHYTDGKLTDLKKADLSVGDIVVITKTAKEAQQFVIMNYKVADTTNPSEPTSSAN